VNSDDPFDESGRFVEDVFVLAVADDQHAFAAALAGDEFDAHRRRVES
jgi:hypothetical protein